MTQPGRTRSSSLGLRLLSAAVFIPAFVLLNRLGGEWYRLFVIAVILLGLGEFEVILRARDASRRRGLTFAAGLALAASLLHFGPSVFGPAVLLLAPVILIVELLRGRPAGSVAAAGGALLGALYVAGLGAHLAFLRTFGEGAVLFTFIVTWSGDSGAYFTGRAFGRHKLFPAVSPAKSVEGAVGGIAASIVAAWAVRGWILPEASLTHALVLGALAGVIGPVGDLCESMLKRDSGVKDSANLIPGHGGVLDRFDSLLFVAPVFYYYLKFMVFKG